MNKVILAISTLTLLGGCSRANLEFAKDCAPATWRSVGYEVIGYEGFQWSADIGNGLFGYGGAKVWHSLTKLGPLGGNGITYTGYVQRWGNECHVYGPTAVDAIKPR